MIISEINGYKEIADLIPDGHFNRYSFIWSIRYSQVITPDGETTDVVYIVLANDFENPTTDMIQIGCLSPELKTFPHIIRSQVFAIYLDYCDIKESHGWERSYYEVKDAEGEIFIKCKMVTLRRVLLAKERQNFQEWTAGI